MQNYAYIPFHNVRRILIVLEFAQKDYPSYSDLIKFSEELAKELDSKILSTYHVEFPSNVENLKNYTILSVLSTSHIAINTYYSKDDKEDSGYVDIEVSWCSGKDLQIGKLGEIMSEYFKPKKIIVKKYDAFGEKVDEKIIDL